MFTGAHPDRFLSHADVAWLQEGGVGFPPINTRVAGIVSRMARVINKLPIVRSLAGMTRLKTLLQLDDLHATFLKMNAKRHHLRCGAQWLRAGHRRRIRLGV